MRELILAGVLVVLVGSDPSVPTKGIATVTFRATDYAFTGPDTIAAGVTAVRLVNAGREAHQLNFYRVAPQVDPAVVMRTLIANKVRPDGVVKLGGIEGAAPGGTDSIVVVLAPGRYVLVCGIHSDDGKPHSGKGMLRVLVVRPYRSATAAEPSLPPADATIRLTEYDFTFSAPLRAGPQRLRVLNAGRQSHHLMLARLHPGVTKAAVDRWNGKGAPPFDDVGGVAALDPGQANIWDVSLTPGDYLLSCMIGDAKDGRPHYEHGMERVVRVVPRS
jgi:uncharacterized cupredoxin-like copper-binding protein